MTYHCRKCGRFMQYVGLAWESYDPERLMVWMSLANTFHAICAVHGAQEVGDGLSLL